MTLAQFIISNMEQILGEWEKFARTLPAAQGMDTKALRDHAAKMLHTIAEDLLRHQSAEEQAAKSKGNAPQPAGKADTAATSHGTDRYSDGFDLNALVAEYRALRASVVRLWTPQVGAEDRERQLSRFNEAIDQALNESVLRYSEEDKKARELFLGVLGHDLRTPLGATLNSAHYLLDSKGLSGEQLKASAAILRSGTRIQKMTNELLDVTRARLGGTLPLDPKPMDLVRACEQVTEEAQAFHPDRIVTLTSSGDLQGTWDETRVCQLVSNLVENAIRHGLPDRPVTVAVLGEAEEVGITVHNDGIPIPQAEVHRIFEPLRQTENGSRRTEGLGLGLYIALAIVKAHDGAMDVQSSKEAGTTFNVRLPRRHHHHRRASDDRSVLRQTGTR
ncbi:MAG TPA: HAMP domain-containing sensor histidine kinase [Burkholderiales bacterium]|nr:HAMP domain-containing sensor histidine kinase [Burkholderiales bacterium]